MARNDFGRNLREAREAAEYTQKELGDAIAIGAGSVSQWERGSALPRADHLANICRLLDVSADSLLGLSVSACKKPSSPQQWHIAEAHTHTFSTLVQAGIALFQQIALAKRPVEIVLSNEMFLTLGNAQLRRAVRLAFHDGAIMLNSVARDKDREQALLKKYSGLLRQCLVAQHDIELPSIVGRAMRRELTAKLAATVAIQSVPGRGYAGVAGGTLMARFADLVPAGMMHLSGATWIPLVSPRSVTKVLPTESNNIAARLAYLHPYTTSYRLPYITPTKRTRQYLFNTSGAEREFLSEAHYVMERARRCDAIFMSVGEADFTPHRLDAFAGLGMHELKQILIETPIEEQKKCAGVVNLWLIDHFGRLWGDERIRAANEQLFYSMKLDELRSVVDFGASVWLLLDRDQKVPATHAAINGQLCNCIVLDSQTADTLLST